jgi:hypothetical protein
LAMTCRNPLTIPCRLAMRTEMCGECQQCDLGECRQRENGRTNPVVNLGLQLDSGLDDIDGGQGTYRSEASTGMR